MPQAEKATLRITPTAITHSAVDVGAELAQFLRATINLSVSDIGVNQSETITAFASDGAMPVDLKIYRPAAKGGAFRRLSVTKDLVRRLGLNPGDSIHFTWVDSQIRLSVVAGQILSDSGDGDDSPMPNRLSRWMGSGPGGVHIPFAKHKGNPLGTVAETDLIRRIRALADAMCNGSASPKLVLLAGGAGNGKTHAVEEFISRLIKPDALPKFAEIFTQRARSSRLVLLEPSGRDSEYFSGHVASFKKVGVIQDASETDSQGSPPWSLLLKELDSALSGEYDLLVVCANRGVLQTAVRHSTVSRRFLEDVASCLDPLNVDRDCWPMAGYPEHYLWPLDIESICSSADGKPPAALSVLDELDAAKWADLGPLGSDHPLVIARGYLASPGFRKSLVAMLRDYEIATAKNLTFRKLFSICAHLFSGGRVSDDLPAMDFAATLPRYAGGLQMEEEGMLVFEAYKRSASFLMFPIFPETEELRRKISEIKGGDEVRFLEVLADCVESLRKRAEDFSDQPGSSIFSQNSSDWGRYMDPARIRFSDLGAGATAASGAESAVKDLEQSLSLDLPGLLVEIKDKCSPVDMRVLQWLAKCEGVLGSIADSKQKRVYQWVQRWITRLAGVIAKRAISLRIMSEGERASPASLLVAEYGKSMASDDGRADFVRDLVSFVFGGRDRSRDRHVVDMASGACRPPAPRRGSLSISFSGQPPGRVLKGSRGRPAANATIMLLTPSHGRSYRVPLSLSLFAILRESRGRGLLPGSLPAAERGAIDAIRMRQDGWAMRISDYAVIRRDDLAVNISVEEIVRETRRI